MSEPLGTIFERYVGIVERLRKECPWDREQTHESLSMHLIEEAHEAADAIGTRDWKHLGDELGDLQLHIVLHSVIALESNAFSLSEVLQRNAEKLIRRHPHVFGDARLSTKEEVKQNWERTKREEGRHSVTDGLPRSLPALLRAYRMQDKVSKVGFDWSRPEEVWKKVEEETLELKEAASQGNLARTTAELGDLLFSIVNYARHIGVHPEEALRRSTDTFERRFKYVEEQLGKRNKRPDEVTLIEMDALWEESKRKDV